ncbi:Fe-S cluster assembly ATPase SufC [Candidatus Uabimicrobium sp. HlEnr_7]|uniref:Fe-S cluster assembly ATPase SufC n=1 Tax=Candidatus Uabimicrobium helgolandensis TaxID=3095367 RepID=UPI0035585268
MLKIKNLHVSVDGTEILRGLNLEIAKGEVHAIMGPNGSGKSTLANVLSGKEDYEVTSGEITYNGQDLLEMSIEDRAREGVFMAFQYPVEIPGVTMINFLKTALNANREYHDEKKMGAREILKLVREKAKLVEVDDDFLRRAVNEGFSGGEKKRNEILQMAVLGFKLAVLDETDSGLDIDALRIVSAGINQLRNKDNAFIVVTHYQRLLDHIVPDFVHVLHKGVIVKSGDKGLALELEKQGYAWLKEEAAAASS